MNEEVKGLKKSLVMAIVGIMLFLISATGVTFAWFSLSGRAHTNITPMGGTISEGDTVLQISTSYNGPFDKECNLVINGQGGDLRPVSTLDLEHFYRVIMQDDSGMALLYENADKDVDKDTIHGTVYLKCLNVPCDVYFNRDDLKLGSDIQTLAAMRLGMKITSHAGTTIYVFKLDELGDTALAQQTATVPDDNTVVSSISEKGKATYANDISESILSYMAVPVNNGKEYGAGSNLLVKLDADEVATVEYWLYLEGCDKNCINPVQNRDMDIRLAFAGVDVE